MKNSDNIEKLFKETFEHFEADVNPQAWANVQSGINSGFGGTAASAAKFTVGKIIAGVAVVGAVTASVWYFTSANDNKINLTSSNNKKETETTSKNIAKKIVAKNPSLENNSNAQKQKQIAFPIHASNQTASGYFQQIQNVSGSDDNAAPVNFSASDNSASGAQSEHKYGKSSDSPTLLIRGSPIRNSGYSSLRDKSKSSTGNSSSTDEKDAESELPTAAIFANTTSGEAPLTVDFMNEGLASSLNWDFGDGSSSKEISPSHTFDKPGSYDVILSAKNSSGSVTAKIAIEVKPISGIGNVPNIFTPNGDGENDIFFFEMKNINSIGVAIYSQKEGVLVYQWNSLDGSWNGKKMRGDDAPEGVYLYSIYAIGTDGMPHSEKGFVTLSRKR